MIKAKRQWLWLLIALVGLQPFQPVKIEASKIEASKIEASKIEASAAFPLQAVETKDPRKKVAVESLRLAFKGEFDRALDLIRQAQTAAEQKGDKGGLAMALIDGTLGYFLQGNPLKALEQYRKLPPLAEIESDRTALAHVLSRRGFLGYYRKGYGQALKDCERSLALRDPLEDKIEIAFTLSVMGMINSEQDNYTEARALYERSLKLIGEIGDRFWAALPLNNMGHLYHRQDDEDQALKYYRESLAISREMGIDLLVNYILNNIGVSYLYQDKYTDALEYFYKSLALRESPGKKAELAITLKDIAFTQLHMGNYAQALDYYQRSLGIEEALGNKAGIAGRLRNIGYVYFSQNNFGVALDYYQKSLAMWEALDDKQGISWTLTDIAQIHSLQNNYDLALDYFQKSLKVSEAMGGQADALYVLLALGSVYVHQRKYDQAIEYLQKALALSETSDSKSRIAMARLNLGQIYKLQGDYEKAVDYFQKSLSLLEAVGNKELLKLALYGIADVNYSLRHYDRALEYAERAVTISRQAGDLWMLYETRTISGRAYYALGKSDNARAAFDEAIAAAETARTQVAGGEQEQQRFFENRVSPYYEMVDMLVAQNKTAEALSYAERAKARVLLDTLESGRVNIDKAMTADERAREEVIRSEIASLNARVVKEQLRPQTDAARLADLKARLIKVRLDQDAFRAGLYAAHPELRTQRGEAQPLTLAQAGSLLPDTRTALLEYVITQDRTFLFVLTRNDGEGDSKVDAKVYTLAIKRDELAEQTEGFRNQIATHDLGFHPSAIRLYDLLLRPARAQLEGKTRILIVPDGQLWDMPFQALQTGENHYLLEDYAICYCPSLTVLEQIVKLRQKKQSYGAETLDLLALGNPALDKRTVERVKQLSRDEKLNPLPEAEAEVRGLAELYGESRSRVYVGREAREDRLKTEAPQYRILHLATHGILNNASPMYSQLVLSQADVGTNEDGLLEAWEIMRLNLKASLVVLSACETARGRVGAGEGVIGLTWALFVAGCPTTVVSQWKVDSASTTELMLEFHRALRRSAQQVTKAEALRQAALKILRSDQYRHPLYWAGFIITGDGFY
jgi:CHAT domain-containing protein/predicted negative regulator of RcsB-dependent stress response